MREELLASIEREALGWPGVWKKRDEKGPGGIGVTGYRFGRRQIGHVHDDGHADFRFPKEIRDGLIRPGRAIPHPAFPNSRTTASYRIRSPEDLPGALELFRMNYERASQTLKPAAGPRHERTRGDEKHDSGYRGDRQCRSPRRIAAPPTGTAVRALTRNPGSASLPDAVRADLSKPESPEACLDGVEAVFLVWPFLTAEAAPAVVDAVKGHVHRIVYLSSMSVRDDVEQQAEPISTFHADIEHLIEQSELEWSFLRPSGFATNTLGWAPQIRADGVVRGPYGAASRSLIHERDIAAVAVRALSGDGYAGAKYLLTGPQSLTQVEQVRTIGEAIGQPLRFEEISPEAARQQMVGYLPPSAVDGALDAWAKMVTEPEPVTSVVEEITGAPARTFREWAIDHAGDFR